MFEFFRRLFSADFMAHAYCLRDPGVIALHVISDGLIAVSYFLIPAVLILLVRRRRDLPFRWAYVLFGVFILACGTTHALSIFTLWHPIYRLEGLIKAVTAFASLGTAAMLVRLLPIAVALPGPDALRREIEVRRRAESEVRKLNEALLSGVREKDSRLISAHGHLAAFSATLDKSQVILQQLDGTIFYWNSGAQSIYGWSEEEALGKKSHELLSAELPQPFEEIQAELLEHDTWSGEYKQYCRDGRAIWVSSHWILHRDALGEPVSVANVNKDVTELKRTRKALRTSEGTVRSLFENASQGILVTNRAGLIVDTNATMKTLFGYSRVELIGSPVEMLLPERYRGSHILHRNGYSEQPVVRPIGEYGDMVALRKNGSEFPVEIGLSSTGEHQNDGLVVAFISDITVRHQADREREGLISRLESALAERDVLFREVHHRVKNNMAVIVGLLGMQSKAAGNEALTVALEQSQQRVASMALIHEFLYAGEDMNRVNFGDYARDLTNRVCAFYTFARDPAAITIETEDIHLPVHRAIPCGLILNELLSNAMKYAFADSQKGSIRVRFVRLETGDLSLSCVDDGVGIPESFDWRNSPSTGLKIVQILVKQLHGQLTLDRSGAKTRFELTFCDRDA